MTHPAAPTRAYMTKTIQFGFVPIKVAFMSGTEDPKIARQQYLKVTADGLSTLIPVGSAPATITGKNGKTNIYGKLVDREDITKLMETSNGPVEINDEEIEQLLVGDPKVADILAVQPYEILDEGKYAYKGTIWQVRPERQSPGSNKPFAMLLASLAAEESFALLRWTNRGHMYVGALFPDGNCYELLYDEEVRERATIPQVDVTKAEINLFSQLLDTMKVPGVFALTHPHERIREYAEAKAAGTAPVKVEPVDAQEQVVDLMAALQASIDLAKAEREGKVSA